MFNACLYLFKVKRKARKKSHEFVIKKYLLRQKLNFDLTRDLPIYFKYGPFVKEGYIKIFIVFFILFCSLALGIEVFALFNLYDNPHLANYLTISKYLYTLSYFLVFFLKLNSSITNKNVFLTTLAFIFLGIFLIF